MPSTGFYGSFGPLPVTTVAPTPDTYWCPNLPDGREVRGQRTCLDRCNGMGKYVREYGPRAASCTCLDSLDGNPISICYLRTKGHQIPKTPGIEENTDLPGVIAMTSVVVGFAFLAVLIRWRTRQTLRQSRGGAVSGQTGRGSHDGHYQQMTDAAQMGHQFKTRF